MTTGTYTTAGEELLGRALEKAGEGYAQGQHRARILLEHAQVGIFARLSFVDGAGRACWVLCWRLNAADSWLPLATQRATLSVTELPVRVPAGVQLPEVSLQALAAATPA